MELASKTLSISGLLLLAFMVSAEPSRAELAIEWVPVGEPGNACDTGTSSCLGSVAYAYEIGKYEVTNAQYAEFLNAVAASDTHDVYHPVMSDAPPLYYGGIARSGSWPNYAYSAIPGREDVPVIYVSFWSALRFANWLHNGQPTGAQDATTTEDGAYTLTPAAIASNTVVRNPGAKVFLPSWDEWHKAARYDPVAQIYYSYPGGSDTPMACVPPGPQTNAASCNGVAGLVAVGSYPNSPSPYGAFDMGGNMSEWGDIIPSQPSLSDHRIIYGGDWISPEAGGTGYLLPSTRDVYYGFRVARLGPPPENLPAIGWVGRMVVGLGMLGIGGACLVRAARRSRGSYDLT